MPDPKCMKCGAPLTSDDVGAHKKLINRGAVQFLCIPCLAAHFSVSEELVRKKVEEFRAAGCSLFYQKKQ
ncbi:MAG: hypothetical protein PT943_03065 [Ruminococcus sp.]|jgi:hypothetical protein|nr:hypothetical protein [Ruminococcus sp.]MDD7670228.1 hypothetical protein [Ruminococcus sp.]MDY2742298.1 hypothetical protein [Eubacteriales bacterium]CDD04422.1 putative uncharacterized protein [Ruminococcus sp. CAG:382]